MRVCRVCGTPIDNGLTLCPGHYKSAKAQYKIDLEHYRVALKKWEALTPEEQSAAHAAAEASAVKNYAGEVGAAIGSLAWYFLYKRFNIDGVIGLSILIGSVLAFQAIKPLASIAGKAARAFMRSLLYYAILIVISIFLAFISDFVKNHIGEIWMILVLPAVISAFLGEAKGEHAASATPVMPTKPKP